MLLDGYTLYLHLCLIVYLFLLVARSSSSVIMGRSGLGLGFYGVLMGKGNMHGVLGLGTGYLSALMYVVYVIKRDETVINPLTNCI